MSTKYMGSNALAKLCELLKSAIASLEAAIPTKTSDLANDSGYLTTDTFSQTYATKTALQDVDDAKLDKSTITVKTASGTSTSTAKDTYKSIASVSLGAGIWIVRGALQFGANTSGYRAGWISTSTSWNGANAVQLAPSPSGTTVLQCTAIITVTSTTTYNLVAAHSSTSSLSISGWLQAVRLK